MIDHPKVKAVGMLSGGLDSTLAAKVVKDLGVDVYGVYFAMPWGCCDKGMAQAAAERIGIPFIVLQLDERYLEIVRAPQHGYGSAMNPCVDCRIHMFQRAAQYMRHIGADFLFTGEVLGQRPMSQKRFSMRWIEKGAGLEGRLLRPLCAQHMEPTIPEREGLIDRSKLLAITGRSRKPQIELAEELGIIEYNQPAGGCLLTDQNFAARMRDTLEHGYRNFRETVALQWGRHFRLDNSFKAIVGRNDNENNALLHHAHRDDHAMIFAGGRMTGPLLILKGYEPSEKILSTAAGLIQCFSRYKNDAPATMSCWPVNNPDHTRFVTARKLDPDEIEHMRI